MNRAVADFMTPDVVTIRDSASLAEAARLLDDRRISGVPVVNADGRLVGVLSQTDLVRARASQHLWQSWPGLAVKHLMNKPVLTIKAAASLGEAAQVMEAHHVHRLVVVGDDETTPIGIISTTDLVRVLAEVVR
jgi:CBS domain-containing protein